MGLIDAGTALSEAFGEFQIERMLGQSGIGAVFLAQQPSTRRRVAFKVLRTDQLLFSGMREHFQREINAVAQLAHPGIVPPFGCGEQDGIPYFSMELIEAVSLAEGLDALRGKPTTELDDALLLATVTDPSKGRGFEANDECKQDPIFSGSW